MKSSYAGLDENIHCGKSWAQHPKPRQGQKKKPIRDYSRNYNSSHTGHGTVMAYYIRRVCPRVQLCVAKLDPERHRQQVTFSIQSADEVSLDGFIPISAMPSTLTLERCTYRPSGGRC